MRRRRLDGDCASSRDGSLPGLPIYVCGCGSELFVLLECGEVLCSHCGYINEPLIVASKSRYQLRRQDMN